VVTSENGSKKIYNVVVTRKPNVNSDLVGLTFSKGLLSPSFNSDTTIYTLSVPNEDSSIAITPIASDTSGSTVFVNGILVLTGNASGNIPLVLGDNSISVIVSAQNGTKKTYSITANCLKNSNAELSMLDSADILSPIFNPADTIYSLNLTNQHNYFAFNLRESALTSTITANVNGTSIVRANTLENGKFIPSYFSLNLSVGENPISIIVTSQIGTKKTYSVVVNNPKNLDARLSNLTFSTQPTQPLNPNFNPPLSPYFSPDTSNYTLNVGYEINSISVTVYPSFPTSTIAIKGPSETFSGQTGAISLSVGINPVDIIVTTDGGATKKYTVSVNRGLNKSADLSGLIIRPLVTSNAILAPTFSPIDTTYSISYANEVTAIYLNPKAAIPSATTITVNGVRLPPDTSVWTPIFSGAIPITVGKNTISILVVSKDGNQKTYSIVVTRLKNTNADLSGLVINANYSGSNTPIGDFPNLSSMITAYSQSVTNDVNSITFTPTLFSPTTSTVTIFGSQVSSGSTSGIIPLVVGTNTIPVNVTSESGVTKIYTFAITRLKNSNANLAGLSLLNGSFSPSLAKTTICSLTVASGVNSSTLTPTASAPATSTITVNGNKVNSGTASGLILFPVGISTINIVVTAEDGTTKTYSVVVNRLSVTVSKASAGSNFSLILMTTGALWATGNNLSALRAIEWVKI